jgi:hypothetical protein
MIAKLDCYLLLIPQPVIGHDREQILFSQPIFLRSIIILSLHFILGFQSGHFS